MISMDLETSGDEFGYRIAETTTSTTSDFILIPAEMNKVTIGVFPTAGRKAYAEYTIGSKAEIMADTARWEKWPKKNVKKDTHDGIISSITAVRAVSVQGDPVTIKARGQ